MNRALLTTVPWRLIVLIAGTAPLTAWGAARWGGTGGGVTLAALVVPVACVALSGRLRWSLTGAIIAAIGIYAEAFRGGGPAGSDGLRFATIGAASLLFMALVVATTVRVLRQQLLRHRRELRDASEDWDLPKPTVVAEPDAALLSAVKMEQSTRDEDRIDFPLLLLTLQDIGRRVSMNLDLDSLMPAILSTAKASLDCTHCEVYLWNRSRRSLVNPLTMRARDADSYSPSSNTGIGAWVIRERRILTRDDLRADESLKSLVQAETHIPEAVAPLIVGNDVLGVLVVDGMRSRSPNFIQMLYTLASIYALGIKNAQLFRRVEEMALRDGLTGLFNHATFQRKLRGLMRESLIRDSQFAPVMSDADRFKQINDTYGHQAGDEVLREMARLWKAAMPDDVILARYGGEEFIAAIPDADGVRATELAEELREAIAAHPFLHEGSELRVTASFGVAVFCSAEQTIDDIVREADQNLFAAKRDGRNRVVSCTRRPILSLRRPS